MTITFLPLGPESSEIMELLRLRGYRLYMPFSYHEDDQRKDVLTAMYLALKNGVPVVVDSNADSKLHHTAASICALLGIPYIPSDELPAVAPLDGGAFLAGRHAPPPARPAGRVARIWQWAVRMEHRINNWLGDGLKNPQSRAAWQRATAQRPAQYPDNNIVTTTAENP